MSRDFRDALLSRSDAHTSGARAAAAVLSRRSGPGERRSGAARAGGGIVAVADGAPCGRSREFLRRTGLRDLRQEIIGFGRAWPCPRMLLPQPEREHCVTGRDSHVLLP